MMSHRSVLWRLKIFLLGDGERSAKLNTHTTVYKSFLKTGHSDVSPGRRQNMITPYFHSFLHKSNTEQIKVAPKV